MNILHTVQFYTPSVGGAQEQAQQISERLVQRGHKVTVATTKLAQRSSREINGVHIEEFDISGDGSSARRSEADRYREFLIGSHFDVMMNYSLQVWTTDLVFPILDQLRCPKVLAPCGMLGLFYPESAQYYGQMPDLMRRYDQIILHSNVYRDADFVRQHDIDTYTVIPSGASEVEFGFGKTDLPFRKQHRISADTPLLMTVGSHTGYKGHSLVIEAFRRARIGKAVLVVIGNVIFNPGCLWDCRQRAWRVNFASGGRKRVLLLTDAPRPEVLAAYQSADVFLLGSKIECSPLVLFEAMASSTPFITVACGNAQEIVDWSHGGIVVPTIRRDRGLVDANPEVFARAIEDFIAKPDDRRRRGEAGRRAFEERFTWEKITVQYEQLYERLIKNNVVS